MANPRKQLAQQLSVGSRLKNRKPIYTPEEDTLPKPITDKLVRAGYHYNSKRSAWMPRKSPGRLV
jgi:hypothetical protein